MRPHSRAGKGVNLISARHTLLSDSWEGGRRGPESCHRPLPDRPPYNAQVQSRVFRDRRRRAAPVNVHMSPDEAVGGWAGQARCQTALFQRLFRDMPQTR